MGGGAEPKSRPSRLAFHHRQCPHETETFVSKDSCLTEYYNALANRDQNAGNIDIAVVVPKSGSLAGVYVQAISAYAPRPHAARLWMEFLYSDEGQLIWLKGYATPARFEAMRKAGLIPQDLLDKLPKTDAPVGFPTGDQINAAFDKIKSSWPTVVGATVQ